MTEKPTVPDRKTTILRRTLEDTGVVRVAGAHDALSAVLAERHGFDALWASGLGICATQGMPDASILTMTELLAAANAMDQASRLPVIADCDTGFGGVNNAIRMVRAYERVGIAGICIEDKEFPKRNSFLVGHDLADIAEFAAKVHAAKSAQTDPDLVLIARVEALIAGAGMEEALSRATAYADAGADAILIHSKADSPREVLEFAEAWRRAGRSTPLAVLPTTYENVTSHELGEAGIKLVIYANQSLRAAIRAMDTALATIKEAGTSAPLVHDLASLDEVFALTHADEIDANERRFEDRVTEARALARGPRQTERAAAPRPEGGRRAKS